MSAAEPSPVPPPAGPEGAATPVPAAREIFQPGVFAKRLAGRYWSLLSVILVCMVTYSGFTALRLAAGGLVVDVTKFLLEEKAASGQRWATVVVLTNFVEKGDERKGKILQGFERGWEKLLGGKAPTVGIEKEPRRF